jgi:hypothetical protein
MNCLVGKVQLRLKDYETWLGANGVSPYLPILLDVPNVFASAVCGLLYNCLCVAGKGIDESFL